MQRKNLFISIIISINIHLLISYCLIKNLNLNNYLVGNKQKIISINLVKKITSNKVLTSVDYEKIPTWWIEPSEGKEEDSNEYINKKIEVKKDIETEAVLLNNPILEIQSDDDIKKLNAKIYIDETGLVSDIEILDNNFNEDEIKKIKISLGMLKFKPATKNGIGVKSEKIIQL